jgi:hypothetical protein
LTESEAKLVGYISVIYAQQIIQWLSV